MNIVSQYPWWMFVGCTILGAAYAFILYRKDRKLAEFSKFLVGLLAVLRFTLVTALASLLLAPLIKYQSKSVEAPTIVIAQDVSNSMVQNRDSSFVRDTLQNQIQSLKAQLEEQYQVDHFYFAEQLEKADSLPLYEGKLSVYDQLFNRLEERYVNRNVGAVIWLTDGIYNQGANPLYQTSAVSYPLYPIALGDTSVRKDLIIERILHNEVAYLGNEFPVEVELKFEKALGAQSRLIISRKGEQIFEEVIQIDENSTVTTIKTTLPANEVGIQRYDVRLEEIDGEVSTENNRQSFYIDVLDGRQKILLLAAAPHPDLAALKRSIEGNQNYEVESSLVKDFKGEVTNYNLVILYQLPSTRYPIKDLVAKAAKEKVSTLFFVGSSTQIEGYNQLETAINLQSNQREFNDVFPAFNSAFPLFTLSEKLLKQMQAYPPLKVAFGKYQLQNQAYTIYKQKIGTVETDAPLLAFREVDGRKTASWMGEGVWRWRIANYAEFNNHQSFDDLISKTVQYLAVKADKSYFRINHKKSFLENEAISFEVQLYNESYELINEPEVSILLKDENDQEYPYTFSRSQQAYFLNIESLPVGNYSYKAETNYGGKSFTERGEFSVKAIKLEAAQTVANHNLLYQLAQKSGGQLFYPQNMNQIKSSLNAREDIASITYTDEKVEDIIKLKWIFYILIFLLTLEWFLRKRNGAY